MNRQTSPWSRFLRADRDDRPDEAEAALFELFRQLPERRPSPGFSARVLARLPGTRPIFGRAWVRVGVAAALVGAALSGALLLPLLGPVASAIGPGGAVELVIGALVGFVERFAAGLAVWEPLAVTVRALGRALGDPRLVAALLTQLLVAAAALRGLIGLVRQERSTSHVVP